MKQKIHTNEAPQPIGIYSQAIQMGNHYYLSGQIPLVPEAMTIVSSDFALQTQQVFSNMQHVCQAAGGDLNHIVKLTVYLKNLADFPIVNEIMAGLFKAPYPARTTIEVSALPKGALIEIDAIMVL